MSSDEPDDSRGLFPLVFYQRLLERTPQALRFHGGDVPAWQAEVRAAVWQALGMTLDVPRVPLNVRSLWKREHPLGTIEKIVFTSEEDCDVPADHCLPANAAPPYTTFIALQGHSTGMHNSIGVAFADESVPIAVEGDRDFALGCMARGIAALCLEERSFGECGERRIAQSDDSLCYQAASHALLLGAHATG